MVAIGSAASITNRQYSPLMIADNHSDANIGQVEWGTKRATELIWNLIKAHDVQIHFVFNNKGRIYINKCVSWLLFQHGGKQTILAKQKNQPAKVLDFFSTQIYV